MRGRPGGGAPDPWGAARRQWCRGWWGLVPVCVLVQGARDVAQPSSTSLQTVQGSPAPRGAQHPGVRPGLGGWWGVRIWSIRLPRVTERNHVREYAGSPDPGNVPGSGGMLRVPLTLGGAELSGVGAGLTPQLPWPPSLSRGAVSRGRSASPGPVGHQTRRRLKTRY